MKAETTRRKVFAGVPLVLGAVKSRSAIAEASVVTPKTPAIGPWDVDLAGMDRTEKPGDDFFRYAGGTWMKETPIPSDRPDQNDLA